MKCCCALFFFIGFAVNLFLFFLSQSIFPAVLSFSLIVLSLAIKKMQYAEEEDL